VKGSYGLMGSIEGVCLEELKKTT